MSSIYHQIADKEVSCKNVTNSLNPNSSRLKRFFKVTNKLINDLSKEGYAYTGINTLEWNSLTHAEQVYALAQYEEASYEVVVHNKTKITLKWGSCPAEVA